MKKLLFIAWVSMLFTVLSSCDDDSIALPDLTIDFASSTINIAEDESSISVELRFSRTVDKTGKIIIDVTETGLVYGTDYQTLPAIENGQLQLNIAENTSTVSFSLQKVRTSFDGEEQVQFSISSLPDDLFKGQNESVLINFTEVITDNASIDPSVGGSKQPNTVYIDLSASRQTAVSRSSWDLGFYSAGNDFRVILNPHLSAMAQEIAHTDLNNVGEPDSIGFTNNMSFSSFHPSAISWVDNPSGNVNNTAISEISSTDADNKVYILNRGNDADGNPIGWKKIRILQANGNYILQHAAINASSFNEVTIQKNSDYNFTFFHFEDGEVEVEPKKARWDIAFAVHHNFVNFGTGLIPYSLKDMVFQNRTGVTSAQLDMTTYGNYEDFEASDATGITFSNQQLEIGSTWRDVFTSSIHSDRFYLVKDADGHLFKLKFDRLVLNGERGYPSFSYERLN